jgi:hypothetical protein
VVEGDEVEGRVAPLTGAHCIVVMSTVVFGSLVAMRFCNRDGLPGPGNSLRLDPSATRSLRLRHSRDGALHSLSSTKEVVAVDLHRSCVCVCGERECNKTVRTR